MQTDSPLDSPSMRPAHPLCVELINLVPTGERILEIGTGSGRNRRALINAGLHVDELAAADTTLSYDAALATHALLHGTPDQISAMLEKISKCLKPNARLFATFGSTRDARYGEGQRLAPNVFAPTSGDEIGVAHTFWTHNALNDLLTALFTIDALEEIGVDMIAGSWAHSAQQLHGAVHWFAKLRKS